MTLFGHPMPQQLFRIQLQCSYNQEIWLRKMETIMTQITFSFDYPGDTFLPGMKIGRNLVNGMERFLSSWKSIDDLAAGDFTFQVDPHGFPQLFVKKGT
ncbi:hypothetical protein LWI28_003876 [Acer negundo]|uniref:Bulb-type lectin domain-containing protein n=1 Tax=Acer negundo TaxID=4023 RepID=A0AAD5NUR0_ACENE|nr:hypothetical protein LWI28_003876 [Acer negundo]